MVKIVGIRKRLPAPSQTRVIKGGRVLDQSFAIEINGERVTVSAAMTVAAAILQAGAVRTSVRGEPRQPLCGMGICYECRAEVNGQPHRKTCQITCEPGMRVRTHD